MSSPLHTAVALDGVGWHPAAWREDAVGSARLTSAGYWVELAQLAEQGRYDYLTFEDSFAVQSETFGAPEPRTDRVRGRLDSVLLASRIAPATSHIGLVPTVVTTHTEPFHAAKAIATLDHVSHGRGAVRLKIGAAVHEARLVGRRTFPEISREHLDSPEVERVVGALFAEAEDYAEVLHRLWDSWEDDAEIRDVATGRFVDRDKLHYVDFVGEHFSVKGPLTVPRAPQGQPVVQVLGHGPQPYRLAAAGADLLHVTPRDSLDAERIVAQVRALESELGRTAPRTRIVGDVVVVLGHTSEEARGRLARLDVLAQESFTSDALVLAGTASEVADLAQEWQAAGLDGIRFRPASTLVDLAALVHEVAPELRRRGLQAPQYRGTTLRENLGLARPANRYARPAEVAVQTLEAS